MNNRYDNLLLGANSFRFAGELLKILGGLLAVVLPVGACVAAGVESDGTGAIASLNKAFPLWPVMVTLSGLTVGVTLYVRGIIQAAYGEAFVALADIAVATGASAPPERMAGWDRKRGLGMFTLQLVGLVGLAIGVFVMSAVTSAKVQALGTAKTACAECRHALDVCRLAKPNAKARCQADFDACSLSAHEGSFSCTAPVVVGANDPDDPSSPGSEASAEPAPTARAAMSPGMTIEFVMANDEAAWEGDAEVSAAFGPNAKRRRFTKGLRRASDGAPIEVLAVHGKFFSTKEAPAAYAPISAARVVPPGPAPGKQPVSGKEPGY